MTTPTSRTSLIVLLVAVVLTGLIVVAVAPVTLLLLLVDAAPALALVAITTLAGTWVVPLLRLGKLPLRMQLLIGTGMGLGILPAVVLLSGLAGLLDRTYWLVVLGLLALAAIGALFRLNGAREQQPPTQTRGAFIWLWLLVVPFAAVTLLVTVVPPGFLWAKEGGGYDVLEYHLQLPKEYIQEGRIAHTPHNVYGNFPANVELLYTLCMVLRGDPYAGAATAKILNALLAAGCVFAAYVAGRSCHSDHPRHSERSEESSRNSPSARLLATLGMTGTGWHAHACVGMIQSRVSIATAVITATVGWLTYLSGIAYVENGMLLFTMIATVCTLPATDPSLSHRQRHTWLAVAGLMAGFACGCKYTAILLTAFPLSIMTLLLPARNWTVRFHGAIMFGAATLIAFSPWAIKNTIMTGNPLFPLANTIFDAQPEGWGETETHHFNASHALSPEESSLASRLKIAWQRIPADPLQRFGVSLFVLAALRLLSRARNRIDLMLLTMFAVQLACWTMFTHLYARFAVPMIVPLLLLAGRAFLSWPSRNAQRALTAIVIAGAAISTFTTGRYYVKHLYHNGEKQPLEGAEQFFLQGMGGGHEHLATINNRLPADARILMIGDAKAFYFQRNVDYCVVFNRNPFIETVRKATDDDAIMRWLRQNQYTHVLVNWAEVSRLRGSRYGFAEQIQPELFDRLTRSGLEHMQIFMTGDPPSPYAILYRVPGN